MKKVIFAIIGAALLLSACTAQDLYIEQNPYRTIESYLPHSCNMEVTGVLTPVESYSWIEASQIGNAATFTLRRNTTGLIRRAEFYMEGSSNKVVVSQEAHALDVKINANFLSQGASSATLSAIISSDFQDDYSGEWGLVYSKSSKVEEGTAVPMKTQMAFGYNEGQITGLQSGVDYFAWAYAVSTEGDKVYSNMVAILPPVYVKAGEDLQAKLDGAKEYSTLMLEGGATFMSPKGGFQCGGKNANKAISGGWNADFTKQSMETLTIIDGGNANRGFNCSNENDAAMTGYCKISYCEIIHCSGDHGAAVHAVGGPVTVSNCYVHDNFLSEKGAIGTNEGGYATDITIYNCIISNNGANGHGPALGFGEGKSNDQPVKATVVSNLIVDNVSSKKDGYASTFICYNQTELIFVNNTVVGNKNWAEYGGPYAGTMFRGDVRSILANNIFVGNLTSPCTKEMKEPAYERQEQHINMGGGAGTLANNIVEGSVRDAANVTFKDMIYVDLNVDLSTLFVDVAAGNYTPVGKALGAGSLGKINYKGKPDTENKTLDIKGLLEQYNKDINGNPRVTNGKVDCGCIQAQ